MAALYSMYPTSTYPVSVHDGDRSCSSRDSHCCYSGYLLETEIVGAE